MQVKNSQFELSPGTLGNQYNLYDVLGIVFLVAVELACAIVAIEITTICVRMLLHAGLT